MSLFINTRVAGDSAGAVTRLHPFKAEEDSSQVPQNLPKTPEGDTNGGCKSSTDGSGLTRTAGHVLSSTCHQKHVLSFLTDLVLFVPSPSPPSFLHLSRATRNTLMYSDLLQTD